MLDYEEGTDGSRVQSSSECGRFGEPRLARLTTSTSLHPTPFSSSKYLHLPHLVCFQHCGYIFLALASWKNSSFNVKLSLTTADAYQESILLPLQSPVFSYLPLLTYKAARAGQLPSAATPLGGSWSLPVTISCTRTDWTGPLDLKRRASPPWTGPSEAFRLLLVIVSIAAKINLQNLRRASDIYLLAASLDTSSTI